jgi:hypothetical protein
MVRFVASVAAQRFGRLGAREEKTRHDRPRSTQANRRTVRPVVATGGDGRAHDDGLAADVPCVRQSVGGAGTGSEATLSRVLCFTNLGTRVHDAGQGIENREAPRAAARQPIRHLPRDVDGVREREGTTQIQTTAVFVRHRINHVAARHVEENQGRVGGGDAACLADGQPMGRDPRRRDVPAESQALLFGKRDGVVAGQAGDWHRCSSPDHQISAAEDLES